MFVIVYNNPVISSVNMNNKQKKELKQKNNLCHEFRNSSLYPASSKISIYKGVPFCSLLPDHKSWGASVQKDKSVNFKLFTFRDTQKVAVEIKKSGEKSQLIPLKNKGEGIFETVVKPNVAESGDKYRFVIQREGKKPQRVRDPYAMQRNTTIDGWSEIYDQNAFDWKDSDWMKGKNPAKVSRLANQENKLRPVGDLQIYEAHIGTMTNEGTYKSAKKKVKELSEKGFNAIELMPVENTFGNNWGYDGVDKFAPNHTYGKPDDLKALIDYAHKLNMNVIMDIVPNHMGADMADIQHAGPYTDGHNCFGDRMNYENFDSKYVREYISNAALNWADNYHCDGIRVDMTKFMESDFAMKQMVAEVNYHNPHVFIIAEDGRNNDSRVTSPFPREEVHENESQHCDFISRIGSDCEQHKIDSPLLKNLGYDSEWDFPFHKKIAAAVIGDWDNNYRNMNELDWAVKNSGMRVKYPMSHDEIGNMDGTRLIPKIFNNQMQLFEDTNGVSDCERGQRSAHAAHNILKALLTGELDEMSESERANFYKNNNLVKNLDLNVIKDAYKDAIKRHRLAIGETYSVPGPKMLFQGDEDANLAYFKFFREVTSGYEKCLEGKGYAPGIEAFNDSKLDSIKYSDDYKHYFDETTAYTTDLNKIEQENPALQTGKIVNTVVHPKSDLHAIHSKKGHSEIFSVANFKKASYQGNYRITLPAGKWVEISNTDNPKYGGEGKFLNSEKYSDGYTPNQISIPEYGMIYFKRVG